jgi:uncharacterized membrane protein YdbT with pleckstrin-like domain
VLPPGRLLRGDGIVSVASERYLAAGEDPVLEVHRHGMVLAKPIFQSIAAIFLAALVGSLVSLDDKSDFIDTVVGLIAIFFVLRLGWKIMLWRLERIVVTDQRIFEVSGVLTRSVATVPLEKVTDMTYRRTLGGRILGYGDLIFETAGQMQAMDRIELLPRPDDFYRTVTSLVASRHEPGPVLLEPPSGPDEDDTGPLPRVVL